jgi:hypothetical protein
MVERGPEKAGVGGSIPSLGISLRNYLGVHFVSQRSTLAHLRDFLHFSARGVSRSSLSGSRAIFMVSKPLHLSKRN